MREILSPCGNTECVLAAVRAGADAIYLGAGDFNARRNAKNFTDDELGEAIRYCHINGVKVYITLNTLVSDGELDDAVSTAVTAARLGADAFIVQDIGLARRLRAVLPDIPLHASTQMSIHSYLGLSLLKELGFCRVVAAREMDKESLEKLCKRAGELGLEVEVFVHGALCMSMSGQCLMSSVIGQRSGNRGLCAQPCRLPFSVDGGTGYDLSLKDLSLINCLGELCDMGVTSFKIEGRMKRPEYVAVATAAARSMLDHGFVDEQTSEMLCSVFSRSGFTDGYYKNKTGPEMFGTRGKEEVCASAAVINKIHGLYRTERPHIPLDMTFTAAAERPIELTVCDTVNTVTLKGDIPEKARVSETGEEFIKLKLSKLGGTCYYPNNISVSAENGLAISGATLNALRKAATEELDRKRAETGEITVDRFEQTSRSVGNAIPTPILRFSSILNMPDTLPQGAPVILPVETDFSSLSSDSPLYAELPRAIMGNEDKMLSLLIAAKPYIKGAVCENLGAVELCKKAGVDFCGGMFMNIYNSDSADEVLSLGAEWYTASVECSVAALNKMPQSKAFFAYGRIPLMLTRNCPNKNGAGCAECHRQSEGVDRMQNSFPIVCRNGFSEILNCNVCWTADRSREFSADYALLYFTTESRERAAEVIKLYERCASPDTPHTRGLYWRNVM